MWTMGEGVKKTENFENIISGSFPEELPHVLEEEGRHGEGELAQDEHGGVAPPLVALARRQHVEGALHLVVDEVELQVDRVRARDLRNDRVHHQFSFENLQDS